MFFLYTRGKTGEKKDFLRKEIRICGKMKRTCVCAQANPGEIVIDFTAFLGYKYNVEIHPFCPETDVPKPGEW